MQNIQDGNTELVKQQRHLLEKIGAHQRDLEVANQGRKDVDLKYKEATKQLEELRQRITTIAELFEKKAIKQRYSFEVLCDFIHDKAKRLFQKYDTAVKDKKMSQEEVKQYYKTKISQMEKHNDHQKEVITQLKSQFLPKMAALVGKQHQMQDMERLSLGTMQEIFDEVDYELKKTKKEC